MKKDLATYQDYGKGYELEMDDKLLPVEKTYKINFLDADSDKVHLDDLAHFIL